MILKNIFVINFFNKTAKKTILDRVAGYMKRAEDLKNALEQQNQPSQPKGGSTGTNIMVCTIYLPV